MNPIIHKYLLQTFLVLSMLLSGMRKEFKRSVYKTAPHPVKGKNIKFGSPSSNNGYSLANDFICSCIYSLKKLLFHACNMPGRYFSKR